MWQYVSGLSCTDTNSNAVVPQVSCSADADCHDRNSCTVDTCNTGTDQCVNTMLTGCCGNFVCEVGEYAACSDCVGEVWTALGSNIGNSGNDNGIMFDVEAINDLAVQSLTFYPYAPGGEAVSYNLDVYTAARSYSGVENTAGSWTKIVDNLAISTTCEWDASGFRFHVFACHSSDRFRLLFALPCVPQPSPPPP